MKCDNHWYSKVITFLKKIASEEWCWVANSEFKYINIRVDTRNGNFIIYDDNKKRVDMEKVLWQYSKETPIKPEKSIHYED